MTPAVWPGLTWQTPFFFKSDLWENDHSVSHLDDKVVIISGGKMITITTCHRGLAVVSAEFQTCKR